MSTTPHIEAGRFKSLREELGYTQTSFAELLQAGTSTYDIERGKAKITGKIVSDLMERFNINPLWLFGKSNEKYIQQQTGAVMPKVVSVNSSDHENILMVNTRVSAGYARNLQDPEWYESLPAFDIPLPEFRNGTYRGFQVEGDSMYPVLKPKEWVIGRAVESLKEVMPSRIYVAVLPDSLLVKKIKVLPDGTIHLVSINREYPVIEVSSGDIMELWLITSKLSFDLDVPLYDLEQLSTQIQSGFEHISKELGELKK